MDPAPTCYDPAVISPPGFAIDVVPEDPHAVLESLREGLTRSPREISPRFFYDDVGSRLFEEITELPEYYPTRTEEVILRACAADVVLRSCPETLIELGPGAAMKTRLLLDAMQKAGSLRTYVPFDVSESMVRRVASELLGEYPNLEVHGVVADFAHHLDRLPPRKRQLCIFLGGTIGNFRPAEAARFLRHLARRLLPGDHFLLGTDLVKPVARLEAAYNDAAGVTAAFNRNVLQVVNRLTGGNFDPERFAHRAVYNAGAAWIEMWLTSTDRQHVSLPGIDLEFTIERGEEILTELSAKYDRPRVDALVAGAGLEMVQFYTDPENLFALSLSRKL
jgi:L-histidine N-alpha-methyltransferase